MFENNMHFGASIKKAPYFDFDLTPELLYTYCFKGKYWDILELSPWQL